MELLFESRLCVGSLQGKLGWVQGTPAIHEEPVLVGDTLADGAGATIYGTVLRDGGVYRMWYQAWPKDWKGQDVALVGYAESDDGVAWRKRALGIQPYGGAASHLTNLGFHSPAVFVDPVAPARERYRATGYAHPRYTGAPPGLSTGGYYAAHSADGLFWALDASTPAWPGADVITSVYHPGRRHGIAALKYSPRYHGIPRRSVWQAERRDGGWSAPRRALVPDDFDDVAAAARGCASGDYYGMAMQPTGRSTIGFLWNFRHSLPRTAIPGSESGVFGATSVSLVFQENEEDCWQHAPGRRDFVPADAFPWARGGVYTASGPVDAGDTHRLYLCGACQTHGWYLGSSWQVLDRWKRTLAEEGIARISYVEWPRWRLFGYRADPEGVLDLRLGRIAAPSRLLLNYECEGNGSMRVEVPGAPDRSVENAAALTGSSLGVPASWRTGQIIQPPPDGAELTVRLHMERATVWAYDVVPAG